MSMAVVKRLRAAVRRAGAVVAVIKPTNFVNPALQALTVAALALPGLMMPDTGQAEGQDTTFQYGHYQEGKRDLGGVASDFNPIEVESIFGKTHLKISDRIKLAFDYLQDTWSGATPVTTAPLAFGGNHAKSVSGASPLLNPGVATLDAAYKPVTLDPVTGAQQQASQLVHTLAMASPETRKQGNVNLSYAWNEAEVQGGAGVSSENDYLSVFGNVGGRLDFNQKLTSLSGNLSYTSSETKALLDHDATPYIYETSGGLKTYNATHSTSQLEISGPLNNKTLHAQREDWGSTLGLTQVLNKSALVEFSAGYTRSTGYLANPYKTVTTVFVDPAKAPNNDGVYSGDIRALMEKRPDQRNQLLTGLRYVQHIDALNSALHLDYRFFHDDWGINAHTFEADWVQPISNDWVVTPRIRYYSQSQADFYQPYLVSKQATPGKFQSIDSDGNAVVTQLNTAQLPDNYSSDQRLSGFGALSGGLTLSKKFAKGVSFEIGAEYYVHAGSLKLGGGGEGAYADYNSYMANAALKVDLSTVSLANIKHAGHGHEGHAHHHGSHAPAGVMFDHMLEKTGDMMVGYRYMYSGQNGHTLNGFNQVGDQQIVTQGCNGNPCYVTPQEMNMHMHMLDLMIAPTDWLTLMLMPQFVDMNMSMRKLDGASLVDLAQDPVTRAAVIHADHEHTTGGVGDTGMYAMFKLFDQVGHHFHATLGISAPTGDVGIKLRDTHGVSIGFIHYGMQLGSGTWDFKPSLTYTGLWNEWSWGAQLNGTKRLESQNSSGFAFGDIFQATAWGSYNVVDWLALSVRGVYTVQGGLQGQYNDTYTKIGPMDYGNSYGGRFWDVGFGFNLTVPSGDLQGNRLSFEWIEPVSDDVNGYQLERSGALSATWSYGF